MLNTPKNHNDAAHDTDAAPAEAVPASWLPVASHIATIGIFILMLGAVFSLARGVLRPITAAIIVVIMLGPIARRMVGPRFPAILFAILVLGIIGGLIHLTTVALSGPVARLIEILPTIGPAIAQKFDVLDPFLAVFRRLQEWLTTGGGTSAFTMDFGEMLKTAVAYLTPAVGELIVFLATLFLALVSRDSLRRHLILFFPDQDERLTVIQILNELEVRLTNYVGTITGINVALGLVTALICWLVGLPAPLLFGLLALVANFVPYIGPAFTILALLLAGLVVFPLLTDALIAPATFLAVATIEGQVITPSLVGQRIVISPLAVFISLVFWIWLWGPVGGFLSVPFLIIGYTILTRLRAKTEPDLPG
jgi:predicted PurR-regulated permease PerM